MSRNSGRKRDRYSATLQTSQGRMPSVQTVNEFRRVYGLPRLTSISESSAPESSYRFSLVGMDFARQEDRVVAHLVGRVTEGLREQVDRLMLGLPRDNGGLNDRAYEQLLYQPRRYGRSSSQPNGQELRRAHNYLVQAQAADRLDAYHHRLHEALSRGSENPERDAIAAMEAFRVSLQQIPRSAMLGFYNLAEVFRTFQQEPDPFAPVEPQKLPEPSHPEAGKLVVRRKVRRTLLGQEVMDYREPSGGIARVGQSTEPTTKHTSKRKLR